ncbi:MAG TPA: hypothetical protein VFK04_13995 [Gemmatimonadaceae bacterium]|jgi:hypothetical protein|nr:hypothetical protein [Gemmatimonadaceae bacterium]
MRARVSEQWVEAPLQHFADQSRVTFALLLQPSGQVLGQFGFTRAMDVMAACTLAAAINVTAAQLGRELDGSPFRELHHAGRDRELFIAEAPTARGPLVLLAAFDGESSLGLVRLYFRELCAALANAEPVAPSEAARVDLGENLERDLNRSLAILFGRARPDSEGMFSVPPSIPPA